MLRRLPGDRGAADDLPSLIASLLAHSRAPAKLIGDLVHRRSQLSSDVTSAFLGAAARNGAIDVVSLASHGGSAILDVLLGNARFSTRRAPVSGLHVASTSDALASSSDGKVETCHATAG
jgi:hypothetical protein